MSLVTRLFTPSRPAVALEIASTRVSALRLGGGSPPSATYAVEALPAGALVSSLTAANVVDQVAVSAAVGRVLAAVGGGRQVALVLPDSVAKVSLVRLEQVPTRLPELDAMLRFQVRKSVPFRADDAQFTWTDGQEVEGSGREYLVALARRELIAQYETVVATAGAHAGLVDLATFDLVNLVLASGTKEDDWLLVHMAADYATLVIVRRGRVIFYRHRGADGEESLADLVHQASMYYEDRLSGRGFARVFLAGAAEGPEGAAGADMARRALAERLKAKVEPLDLSGVATLADRISASPGLVDQLAPLVGVLAGEPAA
jgi:Tfp pilus assembly PilM family ATPase